jgi:hypothetical protein
VPQHRESPHPSAGGIAQLQAARFPQWPLEPNAPKTLLVLEFDRLEDLKMVVKVDPQLEVILVQDQPDGGAISMPLISTLESFIDCTQWVIGSLESVIRTPPHQTGGTHVRQSEGGI